MMDLRIQKTHRLIESAFIDLVLANGFKKVTVKDIAARAMVNRKTFYQHYQDKYDVADQITQTILAWFDDLLTKRASLMCEGVGMNQSFRQLQPELTQLLDEWHRPIKSLMTIPQIQGRLLTGIKDLLMRHLEPVLQRPATDLEVNVIGGVMLGMLTYDFTAGRPPTAVELSQLTHSLALVFEGRTT
ncbi:TetR family transcriptional regulator [Levilactobacillus enshiensis]|uniref:TetR family transcriptional regulator n=1 Tax=Levilactobacillus enshiensis TaxID=2590213 RepID=UPI001179A38C|nr:TetR family transcriptional regulator [Levilactobacillus enshiensis]